MALQRSLRFTDLLLFGVSSIMGSGGFNLIGDAVTTGGPQFIGALSATALLFQGSSKTYQTAFEAHPTNTAESDLIADELGQPLSFLSAGGIMAFNILSISTILVVCSKLLFPDGSWTGQVGFAIALLSAMTSFSFQGIEMNKDAVNGFGLGVVLLLAFVTGLGLIELAANGLPTTLPRALFKSGKQSLVRSILYFYFILAGFEALIKFTEESKDPKEDIPRSFYASNALSTLLTVGVCFAFILFFSHHSFAENENVVAKIIETILGSTAGSVASFLSIVLMIGTTFVSFLASTRYLHGLSKQHAFLSPLRDLNAAAAPWKAILGTAVLAALGILVNNVFTLVRISDFFLTITLALVATAATRYKAREGKYPLAEGATAVAFFALLSTCCLPM